MKLTANMNEWGTLATKDLLQHHQDVEPFIMQSLIVQASPEGNGIGFFILGNGNQQAPAGFIPWFVEDFMLKPFDLLITLENNEPRFFNLSSANLAMAMGQLPMGRAVAQPSKALTEDIGIDWYTPPMTNGSFARRNTRPPGTYAGYMPVKMANILPQLDVSQLKQFFELAKAAGVSAYLAEEYGQVLEDIRDSHQKTAGQTFPSLMVLETGEVQGYRLHHAGGSDDITPAEAHQVIKAAGESDFPLRAAHLMRGDLVVVDLRPGLTKAAGDPTWTGVILNESIRDRSQSVKITETGWYKENQQIRYVYADVFGLDGNPISESLSISPVGFSLKQDLYGTGQLDSTWLKGAQQSMAAFFQPAKLVPGEVCILINEAAKSSSPPFRILANTAHPTGIVLTVDPVASFRSGPIHLCFGGEHKQIYHLAPDEISIPAEGFKLLAINGTDLSHESGNVRIDGGVKVELARTGTYWRLIEDGKRFERLTYGQAVYLLMSRFGLSETAALALMTETKQSLESRFTVPRSLPHASQDPSAHAFDEDLLKVSMDLWRFTEQAEQADLFGRLRQADDSALFGALRKRANDLGGYSGPSTSQVTGSNRSFGSNGTANANAFDMTPVIPENLPGVKEIADLLTAYASGQIRPEEIGEDFSAINQGLENLINLVGKALLIINLNQMPVLTYQETKRLLDGLDRFKESVNKAMMLLRSTSKASVTV